MGPKQACRSVRVPLALKPRFSTLRAPSAAMVRAVHRPTAAPPSQRDGTRPPPRASCERWAGPEEKRRHADPRDVCASRLCLPASRWSGPMSAAPADGGLLQLSIPRRNAPKRRPRWPTSMGGQWAQYSTSSLQALKHLRPSPVGGACGETPPKAQEADRPIGLHTP